MNATRIFALAFALAATSASAQQYVTPSKGKAAPPAARAEVVPAPVSANPEAIQETLGAGDGVRITVFQSPDLATETRLSDRGTIVFPLVGEIDLNGLTAQQASARIAEALKREKLVVNPQVNVAVTQLRSRSVSVLGQVARPGKYPLEDSRPRLHDVIALAGGVNATGADRVTIVSTGPDGQPTRREVDLSGIGTDAVAIRPGDSVHVSRAPVFYIYGEVQKAGAYRLEPNMMVMQAISVGGGITPRGTQRGLKIHRPGLDGSIQKLDAKLGDTLQPNDTVYVKESLF